MSFHINDIDTFLAVARHGQVRRAAAEVGLSQPALTKGLQRLEKALGFALFERGARGMTLTPVAEQFRQRTQALRGSLDEAIKEAQDLHLGAMGVLRVGVSPLYAQRLFVPAAAQLHHQRPAARIRVMINLNDELVAALRRGDLDLCIHALPKVPHADMNTHELLHDDLCMVCRAGHPLLLRRRLRLTDLAACSWMLPGPEVPARRAIEGRFAEAGLPPPRVVVEVNNTAAQLSQLLRQTDLLSVMSESMLPTEAGRNLTALPLADARLRRSVGVLTPQGVPLSPLAQRFLELLVASAAQTLPL